MAISIQPNYKGKYKTVQSLIPYFYQNTALLLFKEHLTSFISKGILPVHFSFQEIYSELHVTIPFIVLTSCLGSHFQSKQA